MQGETPGQEEIEQMNELLEKVKQEPLLATYVELEQRLSVLMGDVQRIISEPLQKLFPEQGGDSS